MHQREKDDLILSQLLIDMVLLDKLKDLTETHESDDEHLEVLPPFEDVFKTTMQDVWSTGEVSTISVFASQVLLDTAQIPQGSFKGLDILKGEGERILNLLQFKYSDTQTLDIGGGI